MLLPPARRRPTHIARHAAARLALEPLEDRIVPFLPPLHFETAFVSGLAQAQAGTTDIGTPDGGPVFDAATSFRDDADSRNFAAASARSSVTDVAAQIP